MLRSCCTALHRGALPRKLQSSRRIGARSMIETLGT
jgi:hypothetical protein